MRLGLNVGYWGSTPADNVALAQEADRLGFHSVWTAEALNTAFEFLTDVASPNFHPIAEKAKDVAAGAVLLAAAGAVIVGALVFAQRVVLLFQ